jgi:hypothetical protein
MAAEPKTFRETNLVVASIEERVADLRKMVVGLYGLLGTLFAAAAALYFQIGDLKTDVAVIKTNVATINERVARVDKNIDDVRSAENLASPALGRIEATLNAGVQSTPRAANPIASLTLSTGETQLIREILKPVRKGAPQQYKMGDPLLPIQVLVPRHNLKT